MFVIDIAFQEFGFIVKRYPCTSKLGARSPSSISYKQKKIPLIFQSYEYQKRCAHIKFSNVNDVNDKRNDVGCWSCNKYMQLVL